jgi:hypothetical protein
VGNYLWFNTRQVVAGTADLIASGERMKEEFDNLMRSAAPISQLESGDPAGTDSTGQQFKAWYEDFKQQIVEQGNLVGDAIVELGTTTEQVLARFTAIDIDSAQTMNVE